jgi:hypothetical protein
MPVGSFYLILFAGTGGKIVERALKLLIGYPRELGHEGLCLLHSGWLQVSKIHLIALGRAQRPF